MTIPTSVASWFQQSDVGAPELSNAASSLIGVLRACLVTGFNVKAVTQIVVASGVATVTCAGHAYTGAVGKLVQISGATEPLLNGRKQPASTGANTFTYPAPGVANGTYTGTMEARRAPLGWTEEFAGTVANVAVFRQSEPSTDRAYLRVSEVLGTSARLVAYATMSDANTGTEPTPTPTQMTDGVHWPKSSNSTAMQWDLVGSDRGFYFMPSPAFPDQREAFFAGQLTTTAASHPFSFSVCGNASSIVNYSTPAAGTGGVWFSSRSVARASAPCFLMRNYTGISGALEVTATGDKHVFRGGASACSGSESYGIAPYPNPANNGLNVCRASLYTLTTPSVEVGHYPGLLHIAQDTDNLIPHGTVIAGTNDAQGKMLLALSAGPPSTGLNAGSIWRGSVLFNMTDSWVEA